MAGLLSFIGDFLSGRSIGFRLDRGTQAVWRPFRGNPEGIEDGTFGDARIDLLTGMLYIKQTASGSTGWVALAPAASLQTSYGASAGADPSIQLSAAFGPVTINAEATLANILALRTATGADAFAFGITGDPIDDPDPTVNISKLLTGNIVLNLNSGPETRGQVIFDNTQSFQFRVLDDQGAVEFIMSFAGGTGRLVCPAEVRIDGDLNHDGTQVGLYGVTAANQSAPYTRDATIVVDRTLLASASATVTNNNNVLAALIVDLQSRGFIG